MKAVLAGFLVMMSLMAMIAGCDSLPLPETEQMIAEDIWDCLDPDERAGAYMFFGNSGKEEMIQMLVDTETKDRLMEVRDSECGTGDDAAAASMTAEERVQATVEANLATKDAEMEAESQREADMYLQQTVAAGVATAMAPTPTPTPTPTPPPTPTPTPTPPPTPTPTPTPPLPLREMSWLLWRRMYTRAMSVCLRRSAKRLRGAMTRRIANGMGSRRMRRGY